MSNTENKTKPVYAFIDSQNLNLGTLSCGWKLDFRKFRVYLKDKYGVNRAFLFIGYLPKNIALYEKLKNAGYELIFKPVVFYSKTPHEETIKGNVDAELVLHTMIQYPNYGQAILVTGDGDFACLVEYLDGKNKLKKVLIPNKTRYSSLFFPFSRYLSFVSDLKNKVRE